MSLKFYATDHDTTLALSLRVTFVTHWCNRKKTWLMNWLKTLQNVTFYWWIDWKLSKMWHFSVYLLCKQYADHTLFNGIKYPTHTLDQLLPPTRNTRHILRDRGHSGLLLSCTFQLYKDTFINRCLFGYSVSCLAYMFFVLCVSLLLLNSDFNAVIVFYLCVCHP